MEQKLEGLILRQQQELFERLDAWLLKASAAISPPAPQDLSDVLKLGELGPSPAISAKTSIKKSPGRSPGEENDSDEVLESHASKNRMMSRRNMSVEVSEYEEAKEEGSRVESLKRIITEANQLPTTAFKQCQCWARTISDAPWFNAVVAIIIVSNSAFLGVQLEFSRSSDAHAMVFLIGHLVYAVLFTSEMLIRFVASGLRSYLIGPEWYWNWLDLLVVIPAWVELVIDFTAHEATVSSGASNFRILRVLRITRMLQVIRSVRLMRVIHAFRELILSILDTTRQLVWAMILLVLIIYSFGILFCDAVLNSLMTSPNLDVERGLFYFGGIFDSMETLFRTCLSGFDWVDAADALKPVGDIWVQLFHIYVAFCSFAVLNVITGVFVNSAIKTREKDHETIMLHVQKFKDIAATVWKKMDKSGLGQITITEFEQLFEDPDMQAFFETIELNAVDAWTLFDSLDADGDHLISYEEFVQRCTTLHGPARAVELFHLTQQNAKVWDEMRELRALQDETSGYIKYLVQAMATHIDPMVSFKVTWPDQD